jgi:hypothetical protein
MLASNSDFYINGSLLKMKLHTAVATTLLISSVGVSAVTPLRAHQAQMPGMDRPGMMMQDGNPQTGQGMMGGMMGQGGMMGHGMMGFKSGFRREKPLSNDDARRAVDGKLALSGLSRLKVGTIKDEGENAAKVDVVTQKGELIFRLKVDRATGRTAIVE